MNTSNEIRVDLAEMKTIRKTLHQYPELGLTETRTAQFIEDHLKAFGVSGTPRVSQNRCCGYPAKR